ncbi:hypothetical protein PINS_up002722 [Pythium insidiosum]|nr:hypothetical protein PINS_up002722 [Pythium insidiosum]
MLPSGRDNNTDSSTSSRDDAGSTGNVSDGDAGSAAEGSTNDDSAATPILPPMYVPTNLALLSAHENISNAIKSGGLGVFVSPRHVLTRGNWTGSAPLRFAHAGVDPAVAVRRVHVQDPSQPDSLIVVELEENAVQDWFRVLVAKVPFFQELYELQSNTMMLSPRAPLSDVDSADSFNPEIADVRRINFMAREESGKCPPTSHQPDTFICAQSSRRVLQDSITPGLGTFLTLYGILVGLADTPKLQNEGGLVSQGFPMLATPSTRAFLDFATQDSIEWMDGDFGEVQDMVDTSHLAVFHRNDSTKTLDCRGVFIAERFVLTTASCVANADVQWVSLDNPTLEEAKQEGIELLSCPVVNTDGSSDVEDGGSSEEDCRSIVQVRRITIHPLYAESQVQKHDIAIVEVTAPLIDASVLRLPSSPLGSSSRAVEVDTDTHQLRLVRIVDPSQCRSVEDPLCVEDMVPETSKACVTRRKVLPATRILMHSTVVEENMLAGFAYPQEHSIRTCSGSRQFVSVFANQNFINALVRGHTWGEVPVLVRSIGYAKALIPAPEPTTPSPPTAKSYVVGLRMTKNGQNFCGGSLIAPQYVLTAAHCVSDDLANWVSIGSLESAGQNTESIQVFRAYSHPYYGWPYKFSNDVAVLELKYSASAQPITIDASTIVKDGLPATMFGYGVESPTSNVLASVMHARQLSLVSPATCAATLPNIDASVLCAMAAGGFDACTGDSGSPLVVKDPETHADRVIGIVSAGYGCGIEGIPGLYARASSARDFIDGAVVRASWSGAKPLSNPTSSEPPSSLPTNSPSLDSSRAPSTTEPHRTSVPPQLEERSNNVNVPVTTPPSLSRSTAPAVVGTPLDGLSAVTKSQFLDYMLGDISYAVVSRELLDALTRPSNEVLLFSGGDITGVKSILRKYDARPQNQREDRFGTIQDAARRATNASRCVS